MQLITQSKGPESSPGLHRLRGSRSSPAWLRLCPSSLSRTAGSFLSCHVWCWVQDCFRRQARLSPAAKSDGQPTFLAAFYCREGRGFTRTGFVKAVVKIFVLCSLAAKGWVQKTSPFKVPLTCYKRLDPILVLLRTSSWFCGLRNA